MGQRRSLAEKQARRRIRVALAIRTTEAVSRAAIRGILRHARLKADWVLLADIHEGAPDTSAGCDGVIGMFYHPRDVEPYLARRIPVVNIAASGIPHAPGLATVRCDHEAAGHLAFEHLRERGFTAYAFLGRREGASGYRATGYISAATAAGFNVADFRTPAGTADWRDDPASLDRWLASLPKPIGLFVGDEMSAWTAIGKCLDIGAEIPEDLAVLSGGNDDIICEAADIPLSCVAVSGETLGFRAAIVLEAMIAGQPAPPDPILIPPSGVVTRRSSDILAIDDPQLARAVRLIREQACNNLGVADLIRAVGGDRRRLERLFRTRLARSPLEEIYRVRVNRARLMLATSENKIPDIARACGFNQIKSFGAVFRNATGLTPARYRQTFRHEQPPQPSFYTGRTDDAP